MKVPKPSKLAAFAAAIFVSSVAAIFVSNVATPNSTQGQTQVATPNPTQGQNKYPPISEYLMSQDAEIAMARSAAPPSVSDNATIKVFTGSGFEVAIEGENGFVCEVTRAWAAPTYTPKEILDFVYYAPLRAPMCFDPTAAQTVMPYYELRHQLGLEGKGPNEIARGVEAAYASGELPMRESVSFAYMWSADQDLGPGIGAAFPHMMVFSPYYENSMLGGHEFGGGGHMPHVSDDAGTPFAVTVIPIDHGLAQSTAM